MKKKMNLSDNDKREIVQLIQENKPIPDKYRFLIFKNQQEVELLWNGKSDIITNTVLPFQTIEHVDVPRSEIKLQGNLFDDSGKQIRDWSNKLIWGNNNLILSSLIHGHLKNEIDEQGGLKLIYIDPPFNVGDDFNLEIQIGENQFEKKRNILEEIAYRDTWGLGQDSFLSMFYERLKLMHQLLADDGAIYVHCDWRLSSFIKVIMNEIFGEKNFRNEIVWCYRGMPSIPTKFLNKHDTILYYTKSDNFTFNVQYGEATEGSKKTFENKKKLGYNFNLKKKMVTVFNWDKYNEAVKSGIIPKDLNPKEFSGGNPPLLDWWDDIKILGGAKNDERLGYPTQKPEGLLERIINASTNQDDLVGDFFCGSGTTLAVAEKLGRKWIGSDLGKFAIHTSRKRMIKIQRDKKESGNNFRSFEVLNLGKYQRESFFSNNEVNNSNKEKYYINLVLDAYEAEKVDNPILHGIKNNRYVYIGPINIHVSRLAVESVVNECIKNKITKVDILCFEHEQGLFPNIIDEAKEKGVDVNLKIIPPDVFDKRAIEKKQVVFHDVAFIECKPIIKKNKIRIELTGFSVDYSQEKVDETLNELKPDKKKVILVNGQIIAISRDKNGIEKKEILTKSWKDWIDYWSVDFDFESKKEVFKIKNEKGNFEDVETGDYIFETVWQSFRDSNNKLEFISAEREIISKKNLKIAVKVIDIFGNDTTKIFKINL
jgi:DNA modification methylase